MFSTSVLPSVDVLAGMVSLFSSSVSVIFYAVNVDPFSPLEFSFSGMSAAEISVFHCVFDLAISSSTDL